MRLQLSDMKKLELLLVLLCLVLAGHAQTDSTALRKSSLKKFTREVEANFLSSYYHQEGDNAAVTGGIGTEKLTDVSNVIIVNVPLDSIRSIGFYGGADIYSSASTDNIDNNMSSASSSDLRSFATFSYNRLNLQRNERYGLRLGFSVEYDYTSFSLGGSYTKEWNDGNTEFTAAGQAFFDNWKLIYPIELRSSVELPSSQRQSFNGQLIFSQILTRRLQMSLSAEAVYMKGLLSTPFHRVYFADAVTPDIERLPSDRLKIPLSVRFNYYPFDFMVLRSYYRYYQDDFGISGNTAELELPLKVSQVSTLSPFYRYHTQTASDYFAPYAQHLSSEEFYTSDYDLSALSSHKYGMGVKYFPFYGVARSRPFLSSQRVFMFKYIELRGAYYERSTGLKSFVGSLNLGFSLK